MNAQSFAIEEVQTWLYEKKNSRGISEHTERAYFDDLLSFFTFLETYEGQSVSHQILSGLSPTAMRAFLSECQGQGLGAASRARKLTAIKSFLSYYYKKHKLNNDAVLDLRGPKRNTRLPRPLSEKDAIEAIQVAAEVDDRAWVQARDQALITLLYACGLRISEALAIKFEQTPLNAQLEVLGKGRKVRQVPVLKIARDAIDQYLELLPFQLDKTDAIFRGIRGGVMASRQASLLMEKIRNQLGLPDTATPHAMRHSFASHLLAEGGDIRAIQELLGHQSLSATQIYTKIDQRHLLETYRNAHPKGKE